MEVIKRFLEWIKLKERLHQNIAKPPLFKEGEIWWCSLGENIDIEVNGKGSKFSRPVLIFKKLSRAGFLGIPMSTKIKQGSWYVEVTQSNKRVNVLLNQVRVLSSNRLLEKLGELDDSDCCKVGTSLRNLYLHSNKKFVPPV